MKIKVIIKDPGKKPRSVWIENSLKNLQSHVEGYIETVTLTSDFVIICNEEGRLRGLPYNCRLFGIDFVGTIILAGIKDDEFSDVPVTYANLKRVYPHLWEVRP